MQRGQPQLVVLEPNSNAVALIVPTALLPLPLPVKYASIVLRSRQNFDGLEADAEWFFQMMWHPAIIISRTVLVDQQLGTYGFNVSLLITPFRSDIQLVVYENFGGF